MCVTALDFSRFVFVSFVSSLLLGKFMYDKWCKQFCDSHFVSLFKRILIFKDRFFSVNNGAH